MAALVCGRKSELAELKWDREYEKEVEEYGREEYDDEVVVVVLVVVVVVTEEKALPNEKES